MAMEVILSDHPNLGPVARPEEPEQAAQWREEMAQAGHKAVIVVPTSRRKRTLVRELALERVILPRITTLQGLVADLSGKIGARHRPMGGAEQALVMAHALQLTGFEPGPGLVSQCLMRRKARRDQVQGLTETTHPLDAAIDHYESLLGGAGATDGVDAIDTVKEELGAFDSILARHVRDSMPWILFDGFHHFTTPELKFLEALGRETESRLWLAGTRGKPWHEDANRILEGISLGTGRTFTDHSAHAGDTAGFGRALFTEKPVAAPAGVDLVEVTQDADLPAWVASKVASLLRDNGDLAQAPGNIAIVAPDAARASAIREALTRAGIACSAQAEWIGVAESRPARMVRAALECRSGRFHHGDIFQLLASPVMRAGLENTHLLEKLRSYGLGYLRSQPACDWAEFWARAIADEAAEAEREDRANPELTKALGELAGSIAQRLERVAGIFGEIPDANKPGQWLTRQVGRLLEELKFQNRLMPAYAPPGIPDREIEEDQLAWRNLVDALDSLAETPAAHFPKGPDGQPEILLALRLVLASDRFTLRSHDTDRVGIIRPLALRGLNLDTVIWAGLNEGEYPPSGRNEDHLTPDEKHRQSRERHYLFTQAFEAAENQVILARARQKGEEALQPGPFWHRVAESGVTPSLEKPRMEEATGLTRAIAAPKAADMEAWTRRQHEPRLEEWAVPLVAGRWHAERAFSATVLESFVACPFRFHGERTLKLREDSEDRLALTFGNAVHAALANLAPSGQPFPPPAEALREALNTELTQNSPYLEVYHQTQGERLAGRDWHNALKDSKSLGSEVPFHLVIGCDRHGIDVRVAGKIDIVLELADKSRAVIDFKTGSLNTQKARCGDGRLVQPLLYGHVARVGCESLAGTMLEIHAAYVGVMEKPMALLSSNGFPNYKGSKRTTWIPLDLSAAEKTITSHAEAIRSGVISLTMFGPEAKKPECTNYCSMRDACRQSTVPSA